MASNPLSLKLADFDLSPNRGFCPDPDPLIHLPYSHIFSPMEEMANTLPKLLAAGILRKEITRFSQDVLLPAVQHAPQMILEYAQNNDAIIKKIKVILDYLGQAYVWGEDPPAQKIHMGFAEYWYQISLQVALPPILSYAPYVLYNWRRIDPTKPSLLGNIAVIQNFLGGLDEDWFVLIHVDIEHRAGIIPAAIIGALQAVAHRDVEVLETYLSMTTLSLESMLKTLERMPDHCDEYIYYTRVRPYLHGWKNNPALPQGIVYEGVTAYHNQPQQFRGESGAQSGIIPSLVAFFDIRHKEKNFAPYLAEMRMYMPKGHRRFIQAIEGCSRNGYSLLDFVLARKHSSPTLYDAYRSSRNALYQFRKKHFEYVGRYIHSQAQRHTGNPTAVGTAGTPFMTSLAELMNETWFE